MGQRGHDASAIAGIFLKAHATTVFHAAVHLLGFTQNLVAGAALNVADEPYTAAVFLEVWVIQTPGGGQTNALRLGFGAE